MPTYDESLDAALLAFARGRTAEAEAIGALVEAYPDRPGGTSLRALHLLWTGDLEGAQAIALGESAPERATRAEIAQYLGDGERAKALLDAALGEAPDDPIVLRCAYSVYAMEDPPRMEEIAARRLALRPHDPEIYVSLGTLRLGEGNVAEAERIAAEAPPAFEKASVLWILRARLAMRRHDLPEAERHAREAVALGPEMDMAWATLADLLRRRGAKEEAGQAARFALEINRRNPLPMRVLAAVASARGDRVEAARWEREAHEAIPALAFFAALRETNEMVRLGKPEAALERLARLDETPAASRVAVRLIRARILIGMRDDAALRAEIAALEEREVQDVVVVLGRAELDRRAGRLGEAQERLMAAWSLQRQGGVAGTLIEVLAERGDLDGVRRIAAEATENVPGLPGDAATVVLALDKAGLRDESRALLAAAQRRFPEAQTLEMLRVGTLAEDGNLAGALHALRNLDADHRPSLRVGISPWSFLRRLARRLLGPKRGKG